MSKTRHSKRGVVCCLAVLIAVVGLGGSLLALRHAGDESVKSASASKDGSVRHDHNGHLTSAISSSYDQSTVQLDTGRANTTLQPIKPEPSGSVNAGSQQCSARCRSTLAMLDQDLILDDETFSKLRVYAEEIAAYLQQNADQLDHYRRQALATTDGDERGFLIDIFQHLPKPNKTKIADAFVASEQWRVRADGVALIVGNDAINLTVASKLMGVFSNEDNAYVKGNILTRLKESPMLQGNAEILQQLDSAIYNEINTSVREAALKAKMQLVEQPYQALPDAVQALRSNEPDFQLAGLVAIDHILKHEKEYVETGIYIDKYSLRSDIQSIRRLATYCRDTNRFHRLVSEADAIYLRHFEY